MTRLRSLIKEVLSQPKKKDCGCGCNTCGDKAPILTEGKFKSLISEGLQHHIDKKISLFESVYRIGSEKHLKLIREARALWIRGIIEVSDDDKGLLETHLGHFGLYEGVEVPLDLPMVNEGTFQGNEIAIYGGEDGETYIEKRGTGYYGYNNSFDFTAEDKADLKHKLNMWGYYPIAGSIDESLNEEKAKYRVEYTTQDGEKAKSQMYNSEEEANKKEKQLVDSGVKKAKVVKVEESLNEGQDKWVVYDTKTKKRLPNAGKIYKDKKAAQAFADKQENAKVASDIYYADNIQESSLDEVDRYSGFDRNPQDPDSVPFEPKGSVAQFREDLRALFGKFKGDLRNPEFIGGVAEIMVSWKSLLRSQLDEAKKKKKKKKKDPKLNKPKRGGSKAYYVYVRDPKTKKIKKVSFGSGGLRAKIKNKEARNSFAARHNCKNKKDRTKAGYWSCNLPRYAEQLGLGSKMNTFW